MYKKAIREKLTFKSKFGPLVPQQLWDLKMSDLKAVVTDAYEAVKKLSTSDDDELSFLNESGASTAELKENELTKLRYEILKDVYKTRQTEAKEQREAVATSREIQELEEILARKKKADMENMSAADLEKLILEKRATLGK